METKDLIKAISCDAAAARRSFGTLLLAAFVVASVIAAIVFSIVAGPRADFAAAAETWRFLLKFVVTLALVGTTAALALSLARPGARLGMRLGLLAVAPTILLGAILVELTTIPSAEWATRLVGTNARICLTLIPLIGLGPLAVLLTAMRQGAPTRPSLAGAACGLLAGGLAATLYAAHCFDDSPFFVATWYTLAIAILTAVGAIAGRYALRW
ncbi:hypothetical protein EDC40_1068 [Aminobacter aminovorans]|uniref:Protein of uncharacterized function (DUF1109) n=1 Tax=Aminobacter aminovorans TaxID=83263 RepID=A0A380WDI3_AMIAI|nr:NrsF family protein [Aminobacter aminovorans]TCS25215.1 hypothetical protein EDC40_1068 [Aminobacter aminovorans]SUU86865.1 Protein of uncharacterised function (DUF1109) [Aminobacter aminovorans]